MSYLVPQQPQTFNTTIRKFEPAFMDVDFDISAIATIVTTGADSFHIDGILRTDSNLVGLFWRSKDKWGHPLFSYEQDIDWSNCTWAFDRSEAHTSELQSLMRISYAVFCLKKKTIHKTK